MTFELEVMLRGNTRVYNETLTHDRTPEAWTDTDVLAIVTKMLRVIERLQHPGDTAGRPISLRGLSWIVNPYRDGVVIAFEIHSASAVAGPFDVRKDALEALMIRVMRASDASGTVH
jgi:hypothetical protein